MKIDYNILWFEDNKESYETKVSLVKDIIEDFGFQFNPPRREVDGANINNIPYNKYDLIIADLGLANETKATDLMTHIRKENIFTTVLFYSSSGEMKVREAVAKNQIDGAYCSGRDDEDFERTIKDVIEILIKKFQDLNNMRGLVLAETSDFDNMMNDIIKEALQDKTYSEQLKGAIFCSIKKHVNEKTKIFNKAEINNDINKLIKDNILFSSTQKSNAVNFLVKENIFSAEIRKIMDNYSEEIIQTRNKLAHIKEVKDADGKVSLQAANFEFNDEKCKDIRTCIKKHRINLEQIKDVVLGKTDM